MNEHSLSVLEFDRFLDVLSGYACSEAAQAGLRALKPQTRPEDVAAERASHDRAAREPEGFITIRRLLATSDDVRRFLSGERCAVAPALQELARELDPCPELVARIDATFEGEEARVRDDASGKLRQIRTRLGSLEKSVQTRLEKMVVDPSLATVFQDQFVTIRHGRYVLPVRRSFTTSPTAETRCLSSPRR